MSARRLGERGVSSVEFAILAPVFLTLVLATIELGWQISVASALDFGARAAGRAGITGTASGVQDTAAKREDAIRKAVLAWSGSFLSDSQLLPLCEKNYDTIDNARNDTARCTSNASGTFGAGNGRQYVRYSLTYNSPLLTEGITGGLVSAALGRSSFTFNSTVLVTNEPFSNK
jgi:Flp pilus assembly protein TadG